MVQSIFIMMNYSSEDWRRMLYLLALGFFYNPFPRYNAEIMIILEIFPSFFPPNFETRDFSW